MCFFFIDLSECPSYYPCPNNNCGKSYKRKYTLNRHLYYECGKLPMYQCPHCTQKCSLKSNMNRHIIFKHRITHVNESDLTAKVSGEMWNIYESTVINVRHLYIILIYQMIIDILLVLFFSLLCNTYNIWYSTTVTILQNT